MVSVSARVAADRPFYDLHGDLYDLLVNDPVEPWVEAIIEQLRVSGGRDLCILDAGCGTGRHAAALMDAGYRVSLLDAAPKLLQIAAGRCPGAPLHEGDICTPLEQTFDAITCRGVLNDLTTDAEREAALYSFATMLAPHGLLALDVREAETSRCRADDQPKRTEVQIGDDARIVFTSTTGWSGGLMIIDETHELFDAAAAPARTVNTFTMRPWTIDELNRRLRGAGFGEVMIRPGVGRRTADRLFVTARTPG